MENSPPEQTSVPTPGYGPLPGTGRTRSSLSPSRSALLATLQEQTTPTTLATLASASGLHVNTVREHLDELMRQGLVRRERESPSGRGRPAWRYEATGKEVRDGEYAGLAAALAAAITRTSATPIADAVSAGQGWGIELAQERGATPTTSAAARREVVSLFDELGFEPRTDTRNAVVRLTRCPLLDAAHKYPDVVCGVHLGLTQGALREYGTDPETVELVPFAEPGACRLHLMRRSR